MNSRFAISYRCIATPTSTPLYSVDDPAHPVFEEVWDISDRITVRKKIPAASSVSVVVEP
jgi:hypothetical protein